MKPSLPQDDPTPKERQAQLTKARKTYQFDYPYHQLGFAKSVPLSDGYSAQAWKVIVDKQSKYVINRLLALKASGRSDLDVLEKAVEHGLSKLADDAKDFVDTLLGRNDPGGATAVLMRARERFSKLDVDSSSPKDLSDYMGMFKSLPTPATASHWDEDWFFAYQTVTGPIPVHIRCISEIPANFPVSDEHYRHATGDERGLASALSERRIFLLDFALFDGKPSAQIFGQQKTSMAPMALFAWIEPSTPGGFGLTPVAIQCSQTPGPEAPIFTPQDGWRWKIARMCVRSSIGNFSGVVEHFGTHVLMDRLILATYRTLASNHPLYILLNPSFEFTLAANVVTKIFTKPDQYLAQLMSPPIDVSLTMTVNYLDTLQFNQTAPPALFATRGLEDPSVLPIYPFREDTTQVWGAMSNFVSAYVGLYYSDDAAVVADEEVQAWVEVLQSKSDQGARLQGIGENGQVRTVAALAALVAQVLYRASAYHASLNYPAYESFAFPLVMSYSPFGDPPTLETPDTEQEFLSRLPSMRYAWTQMHFAWLQDMLWENQIGVYAPDYFQDPRVAVPLAAYQAQLNQIQAAIEQANKTRPLPYIYQLPTQITASLQS